MSRRRRTQSIRDYSSSEVLSRVSTRMAARQHLLAPCPVTPAEVYRYMWTQPERAAIRLLNNQLRTILRYGSDLAMVWDTREFAIDTPFTPARKPLHLFVKFSADLPLPATETWRNGSDRVLLSRLPESMLTELEAWAKKWMQLDIERDAVSTKVGSIFRHCNTMGQIHRLWPNLCSFLPERGQEVLRKMKVRSKLPEEVLHYDDEDDQMERKNAKLDDEWTPEYLAKYDSLITEALLLPDVDDPGEWKLQVLHGPLLA